MNLTHNNIIWNYLWNNTWSDFFNVVKWEVWCGFIDRVFIPDFKDIISDEISGGNNANSRILL